MLMPIRVKFRRVQRGRLKGKASRGTELSNGLYGLVATEPAWITSNQIEAARIAMTRYIRRGGKVWIYKGEILNEVNRPGNNSRRNDRRDGGRPDRRDNRRGDRKDNRGERKENRGNFRGERKERTPREGGAK